MSGTRYDVIVLYFLLVERALLLLCSIFARGGPVCGMRSGGILVQFMRVKHALALFFLCFYVCVMSSGVIMLYFQCVERALVFFA